jgi:hypothetical protein
MDAMPLKLKEQLSKNGEIGRRKIMVYEGLSSKPFGKFNSRGRFFFDRLRLPNYNIPDLSSNNVIAL